MKKFYDLQLFADEAEITDGAEVETPETDTKDDKPEENPRKQPKYSDDDVDKMFNRKFAEWQRTQEKKTSEAERLATMTAEEKANERIRVLEEKLAAADREKAISAMTKQARAILQDANINIGDELLSNLIAEDADTTKAAVKSFINQFNAEVEKKVKEAYKGETPRKGAAPSLTKEQIMAVKDRAERQRLIKENINLFN